MTWGGRTKRYSQPLSSPVRPRFRRWYHLHVEPLPPSALVTAVEFGLLSLLATVAGVLLLAWTFESLEDLHASGDFKPVAPTATPGKTSAISDIAGSISGVGSASPVRDGGRHLQTRQKLGLFAAGLVVVGIVVLAEFTAF